MWRYWNGNDHFYTWNGGEIGTTQNGATGHHGYRCEGSLSNFLVNHEGGSVPVYRYYKGPGNDHFYTTNAGEIGTTQPGAMGHHGYRCEGVLGYCYPGPRPNTRPVFRYWNPRITDHFYTANPHELGPAGAHGWLPEGVLCHVPNW